MEKEIDYYSPRPQDLGILGPKRGEDNFTIYNSGSSFGSNFLVFNQHPGSNPKTKEPIGPDDLKIIFPMGLIKQEVSQERYIPIPDEVKEIR